MDYRDRLEIETLRRDLRKRFETDESLEPKFDEGRFKYSLGACPIECAVSGSVIRSAVPELGDHDFRIVLPTEKSDAPQVTILVDLVEYFANNPTAYYVAVYGIKDKYLMEPGEEVEFSEEYGRIGISFTGNSNDDLAEFNPHFINVDFRIVLPDEIIPKLGWVKAYTRPGVLEAEKKQQRDESTKKRWDWFVSTLPVASVIGVIVVVAFALIGYWLVSSSNADVAPSSGAFWGAVVGFGFMVVVAVSILFTGPETGSSRGSSSSNSSYDPYWDD